MPRAITLKGFKEYQKKLSKAAGSLNKLADLEASAAAQNIATMARTKAPINDGALRASINPDGSNGKYEVSASVSYAPFIEFGTRSKVSVPPELQQYAATFKGGGGEKGAKAAIYEWCRKKGIPEEAWYFVYRSIMTNGIRPQPFLFPSVDAEQPKFYQRLQNILDNL